MAAIKQTVGPNGERIVYSTMRGHPEKCSEGCSGVYRFRGELYCKYFNNVADERDPDCIKNEIRGG